MATWPMQKAQAHLATLIRNTKTDGPQEITVHGEVVAVLISQEMYLRLKKPPFVEFMRASPLVGVELTLERAR